MERNHRLAPRALVEAASAVTAPPRPAPPAPPRPSAAAVCWEVSLCRRGGLPWLRW